MEYTCKTGKPSFKKTNDVGPVAGGKKKNAAMEKALFSKDSTGEIPAVKGYGKKGKGAQIEKGVVGYKKDNKVGPDAQ